MVAKKTEASPVCSWLYNSVEEEVGLVENDDEDEFGDMFGTSIDSISLNPDTVLATTRQVLEVEKRLLLITKSTE